MGGRNWPQPGEDEDEGNQQPSRRRASWVRGRISLQDGRLGTTQFEEVREAPQDVPTPIRNPETLSSGQRRLFQAAGFGGTLTFANLNFPDLAGSLRLD